MEIKIGEVLYLGGDSDFHLSPPVSGLENPKFRMGDGVYAGRDGGYVAGHFYDQRTIVLKGFYIGKDCDEAVTMRRVLFGLLHIRYKLPVWVNFNGTQYYTEGFVADVKADIDNLVAGEYQITLQCLDPTLYVCEDGVVVVNEKSLSAGESTNVPNDGGVDIYPTITVKGIVDGIEVSNNTSEMTMQVEIETTGTDDEVVIDMQNRLITLNGEAINEYRSLLSSWWSLGTENNDIVSNVDATITYKTGYAGI